MLALEDSMSKTDLFFFSGVGNGAAVPETSNGRFVAVEPSTSMPSGARR